MSGDNKHNHAQLPLVPVTVNIAEAIREGFHSCKNCFCIETEFDADKAFRRCKRCGSHKLKFIPGIGHQ